MSNGEALALAQQGCTHCLGLGTTLGTHRPCKCVWRRVFRACLRKFRHCADHIEHPRASSIYFRGNRNNNGNAGGGALRMRGGRNGFGYPKAEFCADFICVASRALADNARLRDVFRYHFLLGADWRGCCGRIGIDRGTFFHAVYRCEEIIGEACYAVRPFALFPLDEYFGGTARGAVTARALAAIRQDIPLRAPLALAA